MPARITKTKRGYSVRTPNGVKAKNTTKAKAMAQERLLNAIEHNPDFVPRHQARLKKKVIKNP